MAIDNNTVLRCAVKHRLAGKSDIMNVYDLRVIESTFDGTVPSAIAAVEDWFTEMYDTCSIPSAQTDQLVHVDISIYDMTHDAPVGYTGRISALDGAETGSIMPFTDALLIVLRTPVARIVGRKYLGGLTETSMNNGLWENPALIVGTNIGEWLTEDQVANADISFRYVVHQAATGAYIQATSYAARDVPAVMGKRKIGRGS